MPQNEKGQPENCPNPIAVVYHDDANNKPSLENSQALARSVFGRGYIVVRQPLGDRFRKRAPSRIRAWRAT